MPKKNTTIKIEEVKKVLGRMQDMCAALAVCIEAIEAANPEGIKAGVVDPKDNVPVNVNRYYINSRC